MTEQTVNTLARFDPLAATIAKYKAEDANLIFDLEDEQGMKDAKDYVKELRGVSTAIAKVHKEVKADALAYGRSVDRLKNEATAAVKEMIDPRAKSIKDIEEREYRKMAEIAAARQAEIDQKEADRLADLEAREAAMAAKEQAAKELEDRVVRERAVKIAAENEKLRAEQAKLKEERRKLKAEAEAVRREKIFREDAENQAEIDKKAAIAKAERDKQEALEAAEERHREEQEAEQAERVMEEQAEAKRVADEDHRAAIEQEIYEAIRDIANYDDELSHKLTDALRDNEIPNVKIIY